MNKRTVSRETGDDVQRSTSRRVNGVQMGFPVVGMKLAVGSGVAGWWWPKRGGGGWITRRFVHLPIVALSLVSAEDCDPQSDGALLPLSGSTQ